MIKFKKITLSVLEIILWIVGGFFIAGTCSYSSSAGPFNVDNSYIGSILGLCLLIISWLMYRQKEAGKIRLYILLFYSIIVFAFGQYVMFESKHRIESYIHSEFVDVIPPNPFCLIVYYLSIPALFSWSLIRILK